MSARSLPLTMAVIMIRHRPTDRRDVSPDARHSATGLAVALPEPAPWLVRYSTASGVRQNRTTGEAGDCLLAANCEIEALRFSTPRPSRRQCRRAPLSDWSTSHCPSLPPGQPETLSLDERRARRKGAQARRNAGAFAIDQPTTHPRARLLRNALAAHHSVSESRGNSSRFVVSCLA